VKHLLEFELCDIESKALTNNITTEMIKDSFLGFKFQWL